MKKKKTFTATFIKVFKDSCFADNPDRMFCFENQIMWITSTAIVFRAFNLDSLKPLLTIR